MLHRAKCDARSAADLAGVPTTTRSNGGGHAPCNPRRHTSRVPDAIPLSVDWTRLPRIGYAVGRSRAGPVSEHAGWWGTPGGGRDPGVRYTRLCPARRRPPGVLQQAPTLALGDGEGTGWNPASSDCVSNEA